MDAGAGRPVVRAVGLAVGLILTLAAAAFALRGADPAALLDVKPWQATGLIIGVLLNLILTGALFWAVTRPFDAQPPVTLAKMVRLIAASALLNYLPLRPGIFGRTAYLKMRHALPVHQSLLILAVVLVLSVAVPLGVVLVVLLAPAEYRAYVGVAAALLALAATGPIARRVLRRPMAGAWSWVPLRLLDLAVTAARLWIAFNVVGYPIGFGRALVVASAASVVSLLGVTPNGLGLREWAVAAVSELLAPASGAAGALATLVDRAFEALVFVAAGGLSLWRLRRE